MRMEHFQVAALAQMVAFLPLIQWVQVSNPGGVVNFHLKIFNLGASKFSFENFQPRG